ncbi:hypothetical protein IFM89_028282 [Coptis chinensis]|uniref:Glycine-rich protein n=1 Tax=Coptis chinensis TaxID=261450 RepID=A0A835LK58_9MAGN|nr:hypothetical protein IFM89_028282 [Coptis chinensis]
MGIRGNGLLLFIFSCFLCASASRSLTQTYFVSGNVEGNIMGGKRINEKSPTRETSNSLVDVNRRGGGARGGGARGSVGGKPYNGGGSPKIARPSPIIPLYAAGNAGRHKNSAIHYHSKVGLYSTKPRHLSFSCYSTVNSVLGSLNYFTIFSKRKFFAFFNCIIVLDTHCGLNSQTRSIEKG